MKALVLYLNNIYQERKGKTMEERQLIETMDEQGNVINFELYAIVEVDEQEYALLLPAEPEEGEEEELVLMRLTKDGEDYIFESIDNDEEFDKVAEYVESMDDVEEEE